MRILLIILIITYTIDLGLRWYIAYLNLEIKTRHEILAKKLEEHFKITRIVLYDGVQWQIVMPIKTALEHGWKLEEK